MKRTKLTLPVEDNKLLLHSCCATCSGELMEALFFSGIDYSIYFYNPNIHPEREYNLRKNENKRFADKHKIEFIDDDYDAKEWFDRARGMEMEPERGIRCTMCFDMRLVKTAEYAVNNNYKIFTSSLGISRWKNMEQVNNSGIQAANIHPDLMYWNYNWRKSGGSSRMIEISKEQKFYQQQYCGCIYSLRDTNAWRISKDREKIKLEQN